MSESSTKKLIKEIKSLPIDERVLVADSILQSLTPIDDQIEKKWLKVAEKRLKALQSGEVKSIPGGQVFENIQKRFSK